ncbi:hypothetical protein AB0392_17365 [Nonomuraea angiospora]|uniref:hypothetical protein n=1 Tax=Nonomuraea angiospora TaxID=46172 RepID=UPI0034508273
MAQGRLARKGLGQGQLYGVALFEVGAPYLGQVGVGGCGAAHDVQQGSGAGVDGGRQTSAELVVFLDVSIVNVALPAMGTALPLGEVGLAWVVNA